LGIFFILGGMTFLSLGINGDDAFALSRPTLISGVANFIDDDWGLLTLSGDLGLL
jgi:hypothetical protein